MKNKKALIFGITGQDGSYLAEFLIKKVTRYTELLEDHLHFNTSRINHIYQDPHIKKRALVLHYGDITDSISVSSIIKILPDEIYNLAAQSHVAVSFEVPEYTANADAIGALRIFEAIRFHKLEKKLNFIKLLLQKCLEKLSKNHKMKKHHFIQEAPMELLKFMHTGLLLITEKHIKFLLQMEFYLIMKVQEGVELL